MIKDNIKWPNANNVKDSWSYKISRESLISQRCLELRFWLTPNSIHYREGGKKNNKVWPNQKKINKDESWKFWGLQQTKWRSNLQVLCDWMCSYYFYSAWSLLEKLYSGMSDVALCP